MRISLLLVLGILFCNLAVEARRVQPPSARNEVFANARVLLSPPSPDVQEEIADLRNPFTRVETKEPVVAQVEEEKAPPPRPRKKISTPAEVLNAVAESIGARGALFRGDTRYLSVEGGRLVEQGTVLPVLIDGRTFRVQLDTVEQDHFVLALGDQKLPVRFSNKQLNIRFSR